MRQESKLKQVHGENVKHRKSKKHVNKNTRKNWQVRKGLIGKWEEQETNNKSKQTNKEKHAIKNTNFKKKKKKSSERKNNEEENKNDGRTEHI